MGAHPLRAARCARQRSFIEVRTHSRAGTSVKRRPLQAPPKRLGPLTRRRAQDPRNPGEHNSIHGCLLPIRARASIFCRGDAHPGYRIAVREIGRLLSLLELPLPPPPLRVFIYSPLRRRATTKTKTTTTGSGRRKESIRSFSTLELLKR